MSVQDLVREGPHRRYNPLSREWVLVSPQRGARPWLGEKHDKLPPASSAYDPGCYLCPGNARAGGDRNPFYKGTFVFTNDFPALIPEAGPAPNDADPLLVTERERGTCRVLCFSPRHDLTLADMNELEILAVVDAWAAQTAELGAAYRWIQVFENKGEMMGSSNPHPHGQIWAGTSLPNQAVREEEAQQGYWKSNGRSLLMDYCATETRLGERMVEANDDWVAVVPFWAVWPYEILLLPRFPVARMPELKASHRRSLARILQRVLGCYDSLFGVPFPYSMGWHGAPTGPDATAAPHWQLHAHFYPPLLRSASVRKFMVGYELLAEAQRDLTAETAAEQLRRASDGHVLEGRASG